MHTRIVSLLAVALETSSAAADSGADNLLTKDVELVAAQAAAWNGVSIARATFLGWTAAHRAVFRTMICDGESLGARGAYCEIQTCVAGGVTGNEVAPPDCATELSTTLDDHDKVPVTDVVHKARARVAALALQGSGTALPATSVRVAFANAAVTLRTPNNSTPLVLFKGSVDDGGRRQSVVSAKLITVSESPDQRCVAVLGIANEQHDYEGRSGFIPRPLGAVVCKAAK